MPRFYTFRALFLAGALGAIAGALAAAASLSVLDVTPIGSTCRSLLAMQQWQEARELAIRYYILARKFFPDVSDEYRTGVLCPIIELSPEELAAQASEGGC